MGHMIVAPDIACLVPGQNSTWASPPPQLQLQHVAMNQLPSCPPCLLLNARDPQSWWVWHWAGHKANTCFCFMMVLLWALEASDWFAHAGGGRVTLRHSLPTAPLTAASCWIWACCWLQIPLGLSMPLAAALPRCTSCDCVLQAFHNWGQQWITENRGYEPIHKSIWFELQISLLVRIGACFSLLFNLEQNHKNAVFTQASLYMQEFHGMGRGILKPLRSPAFDSDDLWPLIYLIVRSVHQNIPFCPSHRPTCKVCPRIQHWQFLITVFPDFLPLISLLEPALCQLGIPWHNMSIYLNCIGQWHVACKRFSIMFLSLQLTEICFGNSIYKVVFLVRMWLFFSLTSYLIEDKTIW